MAFTLQDPESGMFWTSGIFGRVQLGSSANTYVLEGSYIKNTTTNLYVYQCADILHEGIDPSEFTIGDDGVISSEGKTIGAGQFLILGNGNVPWVKTTVSRSSALLQEALKPAPAPAPEETDE